MVSLEVIKKLRDDLMDGKIVLVSDNPVYDRIDLVESLNDYIAKEEKLCKKSKLTFD